MSRKRPLGRSPLTQNGLKRQFTGPNNRNAPTRGQFEQADNDKPATILTTLGAAASNVAIITGLLYYFGWVSADSYYSYLGVHHSLLQFSPPDYLLRSVNTAFLPITAGGISLVILLNIHRRLSTFIQADRHREKLIQSTTRILQPMFAVLIGLIAIRIAMPQWINIGSDTTWAIGLLATAIAILYLDQLIETGKVSPRDTRRVAVDRQLRKTALYILIIGGAVWATSLYAQQVGNDRAAAYIANLSSSPEVIIYSVGRIAIAGPGVKVDELKQQKSYYHFRYSGLRLVIRTGGKYILLPQGWSRSQALINVVPDSSEVRIDIRP